MTITPAVIPSQYYNAIVKEGAFDNDVASNINALAQANDVLVASSQNSGLAFGSLGTAITLLPSTAPLGTYLFTCYGVITVALSGGSVSGFAFVLGFSDDYQAQTPTVATVSAVSVGTVAQGSYMFRSNNSTPAAITFTPNYLTGAPTAGKIAYSVTLQRML
jgi:hypothetical protein